MPKPDDDVEELLYDTLFRLGRDHEQDEEVGFCSEAPEIEPKLFETKPLGLQQE
jgi:hypothetical protein